MHLISKGILAGWMTLSLAGPAFAEEASTEGETTEEVTTSAETETAEEEEEGKSWSVGARVGNSIGQGTFANVANDNPFFDPECTDPITQGCVGDAGNAFDRVNLSFGVNAGYSVKDFSFGTSIGAVQWLTAGGGANAAREFRFQDIGLSAGHSGYTFEQIGVNISPSLGLQLPTSQVSQFSTLVLGTSLGVGVSKTFFEKLNLSIGLGGGKDFHRFTSPVLNPEKFDEGDQIELANELRPESVIFRTAGSEDLGRGLVAIAGVNTEYSFSGSASASLPVWDKLRLSTSYALTTYWSYNVTREDNPEFGDVTPDVPGINEGRGVAQVASTSLTLSYPIQLGDVGLGLSGGIATGGFPKTADNKSFKFPFWNFSGAASNGSSLRFGISANY